MESMCHCCDILDLSDIDQRVDPSRVDHNVLRLAHDAVS